MRSTLFVLLSITLHALAVTAVVGIPQRLGEGRAGQELGQSGVEVEVQGGSAEMAQPLAQPTEVPQPKVEAPVVEKSHAVKATPKKVVAQARPIKKVEAKKIQTVDFVKEQSDDQTQAALPEELSPEVDDQAEDQSAQEEAKIESKDIDQQKQDLAEDSVSEAKPTVNEKLNSEKSEQLEDADTKEVASSSSASTQSSGATHENTAGEEGSSFGSSEDKAAAVSFLQLKQAAGNKSPFYPLTARMEKRQGTVELLYRVAKNGSVTDIQVAKSSGFKDLDQEALRAVSKFKFEPGQEGWTRHPVTFALKGQEEAIPGKLRSAGQN